MRFVLALVVAIGLSSPAAAGDVAKADGFEVLSSTKGYAALLADLKAAVKDNKMGLVTEAGPTEVAAKRGETIPGNRVVGVFRNDFAVTIIRAAPEAMIEAPIRIMVHENADGTAMLAYKRPSHVFAPYTGGDGGAVVAEAANTLDGLFATIAAAAVAD
ncbi:MAG: DUF302 domain-containing protein [Pseudomonadota bacterium]